MHPTVLHILATLASIWEICEGLCSYEYGAHPCTFLPAPPGHTPPCAKTGETFCERIEHYPMQQIRILIDKWGYDYTTLFSDESQDEYNAYFTQPNYNYGPNTLNHDTYQPEPIYIPKPNPSYVQPGNKYIPPPPTVRVNYTEAFAGYPDRRPTNYNQIPNNYLNTNGYHQSRGHAHHNLFTPTQAAHYGHTIYPSVGPQIPYYDPRWRYVRDRNALQPHIRKKRFQRSKNDEKKKKYLGVLGKSVNGTEEVRARGKRQSLGEQELCPTRSQFIMPQAALNNKGNWMYVVNLQENDNRYTQLVKSETCTSQQCAGICGLPSGYTSRCDQKYVQKRLVALNGDGQNLYTDVFWFPSCCVCKVATG